MKLTPTPELMEMLLLEERAREEIEFWESYVIRSLAHAGKPFPVRAIQAMAEAEKKLAICLKMAHKDHVGVH
ncbi:hypothetical protein [Thiolapillus sp.]